MHRNSFFLFTLVFVVFSIISGTVHADEKATLATEAIEVDISLRAPRILEYRLKATGGRIAGSAGGQLPSVVVSRRGGPKQTVSWSNLSPTAAATSDSIVFSCTAKIADTAAAKFDYAIRLEGNVVTISMENVWEADGFDLDEIRFGADPLVRATAENPSRRVCVGDLLGEKWRGDQGEVGRIARPGEPLKEQYHFGLVFGDKAAVGIYSNCLHKKTSKPIKTVTGEGWTGLYTNHHRYSYRDENYEPYYCRIGIVGDIQGDGVIDWKDAACFIHDSIPKRVKLRQDRIKYMLNHGVDFESAPEDVLRKICNISDGQEQMVLLSGWNGWGWDSEYPTWNHPGEEYGGREGLYHLHENAHKHRAYTSMIHNFDDAYKRTRMWDEDIISRNADGSLVAATWWSGGPSFIVSNYRFWKTGKAKETIDGLIAQGLEQQIFSDVFTIRPFRQDYGEDGAGDEETNMVMGKFKILDYLAKNDIYMNSEGFNYEMLGRYIGAHNGYDAGFNRDLTHPPLAFFICHGLLAKKMWGSDSDEGRFRGADTEAEAPFNPNQIYRWSMLISFYGDKPMRDFRVIDNGYFARYGEDVEVVWKKDEGVTVRLDGVMIADGRSVLLPKPRRGKDMWNILRAFNHGDKVMRYPKPENWTDAGNLTVMELGYESTPQVVANDNLVKFEGDELAIKIPADKPYKLVYGKHLVAGEKRFEPLPARKPITYPLEEVIERQGAKKRPDWIRLKTRKQMKTPQGAAICVGSSGVWPTKQAAAEHAAAIVSKKIAWFVRQNYVMRSRDYEKRCEANTDKLGFDNWYLGNDAAVKIYTLDAVNAAEGTQWYFEKVKAGTERSVGWKAFVCLPFTESNGHEVYIRAAKDRMEECKKELGRDPSQKRREQLELNIKVYELLLKEETVKKPQPVRFQV